MKAGGANELDIVDEGHFSLKNCDALLEINIFSKGEQGKKKVLLSTLILIIKNETKFNSRRQVDNSKYNTSKIFF